MNIVRIDGEGGLRIVVLVVCVDGGVWGRLTGEGRRFRHPTILSYLIRSNQINPSHIPCLNHRNELTEDRNTPLPSVLRIYHPRLWLESAAKMWRCQASYQPSVTVTLNQQMVFKAVSSRQ